MKRIEDLINDRRILVTCGTGGVGKTTLSSALAMKAALMGRSAVVITIDPAKRLATSLGFKDLGDEPVDLTPVLKKVDPKVTGSFWAVVPDTRKTFDFLVETLGPNEEFVRNVKKNAIFEMISKDFSGSSEYMALLRLKQLLDDPRFDFIVLDTPPSRHTTTFLKAPRLLVKFYDEKLIRWVVRPANRYIGGGVKKVLGVLEYLTGKGFVSSLFDFTGALFEIQEGFVENLETITRLFASDQAGFLLVSAPTPEGLPELQGLLRELQSQHYHLDGVVLNRSLSELKIDTQTPDERVRASLDLLKVLQTRENEMTEALLRELPKDQNSPVFVRLPELTRDVHSVEDLYHVAHAFHYA